MPSESSQPLRGVIFARVSTPLQSTATQISILEERAKKMNINIIRTYDEQISGNVKKNDREVFSEFNDFLDNNKVDFVLAYSIDRISRRIADCHVFIESMQEKGINIFLHKENILTLKPDGTEDGMATMVLSSLIVAGKIERDAIAQRTKDGRYRAVKNRHIWTGGAPPFGFMVDKVTKELKPHPTNSKIVVMMYEMYNDNYSTKQIANHLNINNIASRYGKRWSESVVNHILSNPLMIGERTYKDLKISCPKLVDNELFEQVNKRLKTNPNQKNKRKYDYIISSKVMKCGKCGQNMNYINSQRTHSIRCVTAGYKDSCGNKGVGIKRFYDALYHVINKYGNKLTSEQRKTEEQNIKNKLSIVKAELSGYNIEKKKIDGKIDKIIEMYSDGDITKEKKNIKLNEIRERESFLDSEVTKLSLRVKELVSINLGLKYSFKEGNKERINTMIQQIISKIEIKTVKVNVNFSNRKSDVYQSIYIFLKDRIRPLHILISRYTNFMLILSDPMMDFFSEWSAKNDNNFHFEDKRLLSHETAFYVENRKEFIDFANTKGAELDEDGMLMIADDYKSKLIEYDNYYKFWDYGFDLQKMGSYVTRINKK